MTENISKHKLVPELTSTLAPPSAGFLLTRSAKDTPQGILIILWLKTNQGAVKLLVNNEQAIFFVEQAYSAYAEQVLLKQNMSISHVKTLPLKTFNQELVTAFYFNSMRDFFENQKISNFHCFEDC